MERKRKLEEHYEGCGAWEMSPEEGPKMHRGE
jgi:hypothetical protein